MADADATTWHAELEHRLRRTFPSGQVFLWAPDPLSSFPGLGDGAGHHALLVHAFAPGAWSATLYVDGEGLPAAPTDRRLRFMALREALRAALHPNGASADALPVRSALAAQLAAAPEGPGECLAAAIREGSDEPRAFGVEAMTLGPGNDGCRFEDANGQVTGYYQE